MGYGRVVVAYDGSTFSQKALRKAISLAEINENCWIDVVHVIPEPPNSAYEFFFAGDDTEQKYQEGYEVLTKATELLATTSAPYRTLVLEGHAAKVLSDYAESNQADLILIGSRGLSRLKELILGSVSHQVVQLSATSVLIVK